VAVTVGEVTSTTVVSSGLPRAADFVPHALHAADRTWAETNCYVDLWIELLHGLDRDPVPAGACALSADHVGDQWEFLKYQPEDLRTLYGIEVGELNVWRPVLEHVLAHLADGRLLTVEVDGWWLPDTAGTSYRAQHVKTTIVPTRVDVDERVLEYLHNATTAVLEGEDFDHVFDLRTGDDGALLPPYVETVRVSATAPTDFVGRAVSVAHAHLDRRPSDNPAKRLAERTLADLPWLTTQDLDTFHAYAFGGVRQFGATADLAADLMDWLTANASASLDDAAAAFRDAPRLLAPGSEKNWRRIRGLRRIRALFWVARPWLARTEREL